MFTNVTNNLSSLVMTGLADVDGFKINANMLGK